MWLRTLLGNPIKKKEKKKNNSHSCSKVLLIDIQPRFGIWKLCASITSLYEIVTLQFFIIVRFWTKSSWNFFFPFQSVNKAEKKNDKIINLWNLVRPHPNQINKKLIKETQTLVLRDNLVSYSGLRICWPYHLLSGNDLHLKTGSFGLWFRFPFSLFNGISTFVGCLMSNHSCRIRAVILFSPGE